MGLTACSLSSLCIHGPAASAREKNSVTVGFGGECLWIGVRGLRKASHKLVFLLLGNPPRTPNPPKIRLWLSQNICGVKMEKLGVRAPAENGEDSGSETGIENSQGKASSRVTVEVTTLNPLQAYLQNGQLPGSQRVDWGYFCFKTQCNVPPRCP